MHDFHESAHIEITSKGTSLYYMFQKHTTTLVFFLVSVTAQIKRHILPQDYRRYCLMSLKTLCLYWRTTAMQGQSEDCVIFYKIIVLNGVSDQLTQPVGIRPQRSFWESWPVVSSQFSGQYVLHMQRVQHTHSHMHRFCWKLCYKTHSEMSYLSVGVCKCNIYFFQFKLSWVLFSATLLLFVLSGFCDALVVIKCLVHCETVNGFYQIKSICRKNSLLGVLTSDSCVILWNESWLKWNTAGQPRINWEDTSVKNETFLNHTKRNSFKRPKKMNIKTNFTFRTFYFQFVFISFIALDIPNACYRFKKQKNIYMK